MPNPDSWSSHNQQLVTELLTSALGNADDEPGDSIFEDEKHVYKRRRVGLFWYTFGLLLTLLIISAAAGYWLLHTFDEGWRIRQNTRQIVSIVTLTRTALLYSSLAQRSLPVDKLPLPQERMYLVQRTVADRVKPFPQDIEEVRSLVTELRSRIESDADVAYSVNDKPGLWVSFTVDDKDWWLYFADEHLEQSVSRRVWLFWVPLVVLLILAGAAVFARLVNRPLDALVGAAMRVSEGDYTNSRLDETVPQTEVYEVNMHFNRMAQQLARIEQERSQMLAGISHDLRTPLARLRLEVEMGVSDEEARERMSSDIEQVGSILNKFLDYARPSRVNLGPVDLSKLVRRCARPFAGNQDMSIQVDVPEHLHVIADMVELGRVIINLLENAGRYGQTPGTGFTRVRIAATVKNGWVMLRVRDYGAGVPEDQLGLLTRPFYRGDAARQNVAGTGLGLTIAVRMIEAMGGKFRILNANSGGLQALIRLPLANTLDPVPSPSDKPERRYESPDLPQA